MFRILYERVVNPPRHLILSVRQPLPVLSRVDGFLERNQAQEGIHQWRTYLGKLASSKILRRLLANTRGHIL